MIFIFGFLLTFSGADQVEEIITLENQRIEHLINGDWTELENLISPTVTYTHSTGAIETKGEFMDALRSGRMRYVSMNHRQVSGREAGDAVILNGLSDVVVMIGGNRIAVTLRFTLIYANNYGSWQLEAWHSVQAPE